MNKCRILPLYGILDLVDNETLPICRRERIMKMMPTMRMMTKMESNEKIEKEDIEKDEMNRIIMADIKNVGINADDDDKCPLACEEDNIDVDMSFTILSDENFEKGWNMWSQLPRNRTKYDALFMEIYFASLRTQAKVIQFVQNK